MTKNDIRLQLHYLQSEQRLARTEALKAIRNARGMLDEFERGLNAPDPTAAGINGGHFNEVFRALGKFEASKVAVQALESITEE